MAGEHPPTRARETGGFRSSPGRPRFHFSPPRGWLNDPNGLVSHRGEHHLFFQHNPESDTWGPMHWGHAVSVDLVRWKHLPVALSPDELGWIYSGSAVVDHDGSAGFGSGAFVAVFTHATAGRQVQSVAFSVDDGRTWTTDPANPVLSPPRRATDFRDPKVFRWSRNGASHWVMVLAAGPRILFHTSPDLRHWTLASELVPAVPIETTCETPDLLALRVDETDERRWVLSFGVMDGAPSGGTGTGYLVGDFGGGVFTPECDEVRWADHGPDFYAAQSWNDLPTDDPVWIAWMSNWRYANRVPSSGWRGVMTVPRCLGLTLTSAGPRLRQWPVRALDDCRVQRLCVDEVTIPGPDPFGAVRCRHFDLTFHVDLDRSSASALEVHTMVGSAERTVIRYDLDASVLSVDRSQAGVARFHREYPRSASAPVARRGGHVSVRVLGDGCSVEVFADDGVVSLSALVYPGPDSDGFELRSTGGTAVVERIELFEISL